MHSETLDITAIPVHDDVQFGITITEVVQTSASTHSLRNEGMEGKSILLKLYAKEYLVRDGQVSAQTPEHIGGVELGGNIAIVQIEILLVGTEESGRTEDRAYGLHHTLFVTHPGIGKSPPRCHPRPQGIVVIRRHVGNLRIEDGSTKGCGRIVLRDAPAPLLIGYPPHDGKSLAKRFGTRIHDEMVATIQVHSVITLVRHP